jgi:hypothetical protein
VGEDKIAEELAEKYDVLDSPSTIRPYKIPRPNAPRGGWTWRTFIHNPL